MVMGAILLAMVSFSVTLPSLIWVMRKMSSLGRTGTDVNKRPRRDIPEMGGLSLLFGVPASLILAGALRDYLMADLTPLLASMGVFMTAASIGILDDLSILRRREKMVLVAMAGAPLIMIHTVDLSEIPMIVTTLSFSAGALYALYWLVIVPIGVGSAANAINLSAGYNGLETGEVAIITLSLMVVSFLKGEGTPLLILSALFGSVMALYLFNRYPARTFVGDTGTLAMGALIGAAVIVGKIQIYGVICILPAFYEFFATVYYASKRIERRDACMNPIIDDDGRIHPPPGSERYTLAYFILSRKPMREKELVRILLTLYALSGLLAVGLAYLA